MSTILAVPARCAMGAMGARAPPRRAAQPPVAAAAQRARDGHVAGDWEKMPPPRPCAPMLRSCAFVGSGMPSLRSASRPAGRGSPSPSTTVCGFDPNTAWSVSASSLAPQLFQFSLIPYLGFLYFIGKPEAKTPPLANWGFRFLLLFVFATIPAGVMAKSQYGDILANVDVLHGTSESLLTVTNILLAVGFRQALIEARGEVADAEEEGRGEGGFAKDAGALAVAALGAAALVASHVTGVDTALAARIGEEPANALSLPTWAIHVSSVSEYVLAMSFIWQYGEVSGNPRWKGLVWGMVPSLAGAFTAVTCGESPLALPCTPPARGGLPAAFHLFYNAQPELTAMVPLQAGLTLLGNCTVLAAAARLPAPAEETPAAAVAAGGAAAGVGGGRGGYDESSAQFLLTLLLGAAGGGAVIKYGEAAAHVSSIPPSFPLAVAVVAGSTAAGAAWAMRGPGEEGGEEVFDKTQLMADIKSKGLAGTLAYVITELVFWAVTYHSTTGEWLSWNVDKAQLLGLAATFVTGVRVLVPVRMGAALALIPFVEENIVKKMGKGGGEGGEGEGERGDSM